MSTNIKEVTDSIFSGSIVSALSKELSTKEKEHIKNSLENTLQLILAPILQLADQMETSPELTNNVRNGLSKKV